jgi:hypothetical protein
MSTRKYKILFLKYLAIIFIILFSIKVLAESIEIVFKKLIESDKFVFFLIKNIQINTSKLANYKPTEEEKIEFNNNINKIINNWRLLENDKIIK